MHGTLAEASRPNHQEGAGGNLITHIFDSYLILKLRSIYKPHKMNYQQGEGKGRNHPLHWSLQGSSEAQASGLSSRGSSVLIVGSLNLNRLKPTHCNCQSFLFQSKIDRSVSWGTLRFHQVIVGTGRWPLTRSLSHQGPEIKLEVRAHVLRYWVDLAGHSLQGFTVSNVGFLPLACSQAPQRLQLGKFSLIPIPLVRGCQDQFLATCT